MIARTIVFALLAMATTPCWAELKPAEIAIVAAKGSRDSEALAKYYADKRGIPTANICLVDFPPGETLQREQWQFAVRPEIRKWIAENDPDSQLKCLVTLFDVPLKIGPAAAKDLDTYHAFLAGERGTRIKQLHEVSKAFDAMAPALPSDQLDAAATKAVELDAAKAADPAKPMSEIDQIKAELETALQTAQQRVAKIANAGERQTTMQQMQQLAAAVGGINVLVGAMGGRIQADPNTPQEFRSEFDALRGRGTGLLEAKSLLDQRPLGYLRDALILPLVDRSQGMVSTVQWLDSQLEIVKQNQTGASFDSELSLVMWPDGYELLRWQPNYLKSTYDSSELRPLNRTLMVSRLDAPTLALAKGLVDAALQVEEAGLKGKFYIDARGLAKLDATPHVPGSYEDFDRALLATAKGVAEQTDLEVVLNEKPQLFQSGECPDAALYCGWYSVGNYIDAFDWAPGAVAYHLASSEADTLRNPDSQVWCKRMIEDGVAATIGPVFEPYLFSFPRPEEFFALLIRGELTLVECYYRTQPLTSWNMALIGDPLYRPFKNRPMSADKKLDVLPQAPAAQVTPPTATE